MLSQHQSNFFEEIPGYIVTFCESWSELRIIQ